MADAVLPPPPSGGGLRSTQPGQDFPSGSSSLPPPVARRLPDVEGMAVLARHLAPVAIALFLALGWFFAGYFFQPILNIPLGILTITALVGITAWDYRADIRQRHLLAELHRQAQAAAEDARRRQAHITEDVSRVAAVAIETATPSVVLGVELGVIGAMLADLLSSPSAARRERLLEDIERAGVRACAYLSGNSCGGEAAVLYRRAGRRFEPAWPVGTWANAPRALARTSEEARELRSILRRGEALQTTMSLGDGSSQTTVRIPVRAGRRGVAVLWVERPGDDRLDARELASMLAVAHLLAAADAGVRRGAPQASARARARGARDDIVPGAPLVTPGAVQSDLTAKLRSAVETPESRQALGAGRAVSPRR